MKKNPQATAATRQALMTAFCQLAKTIPIEKITVRALTQRAGYNRSTFYQYFDDVYAVLAEVEDLVITQIKHNFVTNFKQDELVPSFIAAFAQLHAEMATYYDVVLRGNNRSTFTERLKVVIKGELMRVAHLPSGHVQVDYVTDFYLSGVIAVLQRWLAHGRDIPAEELATLIQGMVSEGIASELRRYQ